MGLESGTYISDLVATNPTGSDQKSQGDDHIRLIKSTVKSTFPNISGAVTPTHTELNYVDGVTAPIQAQIDTKAPIANPTFTGTVAMPATTSIGDVSAAELAHLDGVTSAIQAQIDSKAPSASPTFTGTATLPATTSIGTVSATEIGYLDGATSNLQAQIDAKAPLVSPALTGTPTAPTAAPSTNTTQIATTEFVQNVAMNTSLPSQSGNAGKYLRTDGSNAEWIGLVAGLPTLTKSGAYTAVTVDSGSLISCTGTGWTLSFDPAATLGATWWCYVHNAGPGEITLDPSGAETIDGVTNFTMYPGEARIVRSTGAAFASTIVQPFFREWTAGGTFAKPPGYSLFGYHVVAGGASGGKSGSASRMVGGGGGGAGPSGRLPPSAFGASETITVGSGGAAVSATGNGNPGGDSSIGSVVTAKGGGAGGGDASASRYGGGGGGTATAGGAGGASSGAGGTGLDSEDQYSGASSSGSVSSAREYGGGAGGAALDASGSGYGGGGGGGVTNTGTVKAAGRSQNAGSGGAASSAGDGTAGTVPGGGGGATQTGTSSGAGADGRVRIWGIV